MGEEFQIEVGHGNSTPYDLNRGHYNLWRAVLYLGVYDFRCAAAKIGRLPINNEEVADLEPPHMRQAMRWLMVEESFPGSYVWVCTLLGIDHSTLRKKVLQLCEMRDWSGVFTVHNSE